MLGFSDGVGRMLLNDVEKAMMNNPLRAGLQRHWEARRLLRMGGSAPPGAVLEVGCGRGVGAAILLDCFRAQRVEAFDLDPDMVRRAYRRHQRRGNRARFWVGDVTCIPVPDATYGAVFDFGIIHHVPNWRDALKEVYRVLRPGGRFYVEEIMSRFLRNPFVRHFTVHPAEDRFDKHGFIQGLEDCGFTVTKAETFLEWAGWFIAEKPER